MQSPREKESGGTAPATRGPRVRAVPISSEFVFFYFWPNFIAFLSYILTKLRYGLIFENFFRSCPKKTRFFRVSREKLYKNAFRNVTRVLDETGTKNLSNSLF